MSLWQTLAVILVVNQLRELLLAWILTKAASKGKIELYDIRLTPGNQKWWLGIPLVLLIVLGIFTRLDWALLLIILPLLGHFIESVLPILNWSIMIENGRLHPKFIWKKSFLTNEIIDAFSPEAYKIVFLTEEKRHELEFNTLEETERFLNRLKQIIEAPKRLRLLSDTINWCSIILQGPSLFFNVNFARPFRGRIPPSSRPSINIKCLQHFKNA